MARRRVVLTGAPAPGSVLADLTDPDRDADRRRFRAADAVVPRRASAGWSWPAPTTPPRRRIGYAPDDDSQVTLAGRIAAIARAARRR